MTETISLSEIPSDVRQLLSAEQAWHYEVIPLKNSGDSLTLAISSDKNPTVVRKELSVLINKKVSLHPHPADAIREGLNKYYRRSLHTSNIARIDTTKADVFLKQVILEAKSMDASDIHLEAYNDHARVRMRIDGHLIEKYKLELQYYPALVNKVKISAHLNISEKRLPQDGRIVFKESGEDFDIRVSIIPTLHGEKVVMRLLGKDASHLELSQLGLSEAQQKSYLKGVSKPNGIVLISGPTGSGKTTTLYATLKMLNKEGSNIVTIEDPIEYTLDGINQVQLKEDIGLNFPSALKSFLRQDPDIIMLGEIRDRPTAEIAVRAALTGHLVLSTIHTNSAWGTVSRLSDMGIPDFLIASTLNLSVAQRLIRKLCVECKESTTIELDDMWPSNIIKPEKVMRPTGCEHCHYTGYKGRIAVYEVLEINQKLRESVKEGATDISQYTNENKVITIGASALQHLYHGDTSLDEVYPLISE